MNIDLNLRLPRLSASHLQKRYGKRTVVKDVSLDVESGEIIGLLGPNGAGKTTCFYMIVGLVGADGGEIKVDDIAITHLAIHKRARMGLSYLPQEASVFRKLTVEENVRAVLELTMDGSERPHGHPGPAALNGAGADLAGAAVDSGGALSAADHADSTAAAETAGPLSTRTAALPRNTAESPGAPGNGLLGAARRLDGIAQAVAGSYRAADDSQRDAERAARPAARGRAGALRRSRVEDIEVELNRLLADLHIAHLRQAPAMSLSGGERRRVEIARALATFPRFILLDEPFAGVDPIAVLEIQRIIRFLKDRSIGVLITDHNVRETLGICDRAYIINEGIVLADGHPDEIVGNESVRKVYLGQNFRL